MQLEMQSSVLLGIEYHVASVSPASEFHRALPSSQSVAVGQAALEPFARDSRTFTEKGDQ